ncbi:MAG: ATP-dependent metallopeptidase FtsH/Yme1/Tma family protein, partial [Alcanivoracaceae bacterium]
MNDIMRNVILWMVIAGVLYVVAQSITPQAQTREVNYSEFIQMVKSGQVEEVQIGTNRISGTLSGTSIGGADQFETVKPPILDLDLLATLDENGVTIIGKEPERESFLTQLFLSILPILLVLGIFMFFMRQMQGGGRGGAGPMTFGKSRARLLGEDQIKTTFADVAGVEEAKEEVQELVEFLRDPGKFQR